ncbi:MAG TPA: TlpA disulfide reductase family protein, partial [bacterium]|nr:TlpA disulfide reductase family protein [bacterium]
SLPSLDSQTVTLSQFKGKPVMLAFLASWSGSCKRQAPIVETVFQASKSQDLVVIGIFSERAEDKIKEFATTQGLTFPIVVDAEKSVMKDFNVNSWPCFVLLDKEGSVKKELPGMRTSDELREALGTLGQ